MSLTLEQQTLAVSMLKNIEDEDGLLELLDSPNVASPVKLSICQYFNEPCYNGCYSDKIAKVLVELLKKQ